MNARVLRLRADIAQDVTALHRQWDVLARTDPAARHDEATRALVAWALHHAYTALESILERTARVLEGGPPDGSDWHRDLLEGAFRAIPDARPAVLTRGLAPTLHDLRGFRHVVRHAYDMDLDAELLAALRSRVLASREQVAQDLAAFDGWLGKLAQEP